MTELTADDKHLSLEDLRRLSMEALPDGTFAQRIVVVTIGEGGDFNNDFNNDFDI